MKDALGSVGTVLVLGGSSEIGLAIAERLRGPRTRAVVLAGRHPDKMAAGLDGAVTERWDAVDTAGHSAFLDRVAAAHGDLDVIVLAAGQLGDQDVLQRDAAAAGDLLDVNAAGSVAALIAAGQQLRRQGHGALVVLSSVAAERPRKSNFVYGASKAALDAAAQGLADSLHGTGVEVLVVRPGFVKTKMTAHLDPAPLATTPEKVADVVARGLARGGGTVWAPGPMRWVMLILRLMPRAIFRRLDF